MYLSTTQMKKTEYSQHPRNSLLSLPFQSLTIYFFPNTTLNLLLMSSLILPTCELYVEIIESVFLCTWFLLLSIAFEISETVFCCCVRWDTAVLYVAIVYSVPSSRDFHCMRGKNLSIKLLMDNLAYSGFCCYR